MNLTSEQIEIVNCQFNNILLINAFAGTGKTTTLVEFCKKRPKDKILYLCYNRGLKEEAKEKFKDLKNVKVSTIHYIAYKKIGYKYSHKIGNIRPYDLSKYFYGDMKYYYGYYSLLILNEFLNSGDTFEYFYKNLDSNIYKILTGFDGKYNVSILKKAFNKIWYDLLEKDNLKIEHDVYLKLYQLGKPNLTDYDYILIDESQDINGCMLDIILKQKTKKVFIGDSHQQIYAWRGSKNTFKILEQEKEKIELSLTGSFRCTKNITDIANNYLKLLGAKTEVEGLNKNRTNLDNQTIIGRTNAGIISYIINNKGRVFYVGGFDSYNFDLLLDIYYLYLKEFKKIQNNFIKLFSSFEVLFNYSIEGSDIEIKTLCDIVGSICNNKINLRELRGVSDIEELINLLRKEATTDYLYSDYAVTTAHKSKGLEWQNIILLEDFYSISSLIGEILPFDKERFLEEVNLLYVASTRAKQKIKIPEFYLMTKEELEDYLKILEKYKDIDEL